MRERRHISNFQPSAFVTIEKAMLVLEPDDKERENTITKNAASCAAPEPQVIIRSEAPAESRGFKLTMQGFNQSDIREFIGA